MTFDDMLPDLLVEVDGCPEVTAISHLRKAARAFCESTHVWTVTLDPFNTAAATAAYTLALPAASSVVRLARVNVGDEKGVEILDLEEAKAELDCGRQRTFAWWDAGQLHIGPTPTRVLPVSVQLSLKPSLSADGVPDWLAEDHAETIREGAKATLFAMPRKDWTDLAAANIAAGESASDTNAAAINKTKGRARTRSRRTTFY
jgi:hypothetical protein